MNEEKFRSAVLKSADALVSRVLDQRIAPAVVYDLQLIGTKPLLSVKSDGSQVRGSQVVVFGEKLTELIGGEWRLGDQYQRTKVTGDPLQGE